MQGHELARRVTIRWGSPRPWSIPRQPYAKRSAALAFTRAANAFTLVDPLEPTWTRGSKLQGPNHKEQSGGQPLVTAARFHQRSIVNKNLWLQLHAFTKGPSKDITSIPKERERVGHLPLDSGEVLSGYLMHRLPKQKKKTLHGVFSKLIAGLA